MLSDTVGDLISYYRQQRNWSRARLAAECADLGMPELNNSVLTNIELGRRNSAGDRSRKINVDELFVIAMALCVAPIMLLIGYPLQITAEVAPGRNVEADRAAMWIEGLFWLRPSTRPAFMDKTLQRTDDENHNFWRNSLRPLDVLQQHQEYQTELMKLLFQRNSLERKRQGLVARSSDTTSHDAQVKELDEAHINTERDLVLLRQNILTLGYPMPPLLRGNEHLNDPDVVRMYQEQAIVTRESRERKARRARRRIARQSQEFNEEGIDLQRGRLEMDPE